MTIDRNVAINGHPTGHGTPSSRSFIATLRRRTNIAHHARPSDGHPRQRCDGRHHQSGMNSISVPEYDAGKVALRILVCMGGGLEVGLDGLSESACVEQASGDVVVEIAEAEG
ncbi:hypothetical protein, partial [Bifidobacterium moraviense]|uniref:hypothetical protein n=1 Tax=Bifidobacterium moraviense TaxID=2675323 RepID=UPI00197C91BE